MDEQPIVMMDHAGEKIENFGTLDRKKGGDFDATQMDLGGDYYKCPVSDYRSSG